MARPKSMTKNKGGIRFWHKVLAALVVVGVVRSRS